MISRLTLLMMVAFILIALVGCDRQDSITGTANDPTVTGVSPKNAKGIECMVGCTRTPGYWKTHSSHGPAPYDATWALLPGGLGADRPFFETGKTWYEIFWTSSARGNVFINLAHQYMATALNIRTGATVITEVGLAMTRATYLLDQYDGNPMDIDEMSRPDRADFIATALLLDNYNNGLIGPGHCPD